MLTFQRAFGYNFWSLLNIALDFCGGVFPMAHSLWGEPTKSYPIYAEFFTSLQWSSGTQRTENYQWDNKVTISTSPGEPTELCTDVVFQGPVESHSKLIIFSSFPHSSLCFSIWPASTLWQSTPLSNTIPSTESPTHHRAWCLPEKKAMFTQFIFIIRWGPSLSIQKLVVQDMLATFLRSHLMPGPTHRWILHTRKVPNWPNKIRGLCLVSVAGGQQQWEGAMSGSAFQEVHSTCMCNTPWYLTMYWFEARSGMQDLSACQHGQGMGAASESNTWRP